MTKEAREEMQAFLQREREQFDTIMLWQNCRISTEDHMEPVESAWRGGYIYGREHAPGVKPRIEYAQEIITTLVVWFLNTGILAGMVLLILRTESFWPLVMLLGLGGTAPMKERRKTRRHGGSGESGTMDTGTGITPIVTSVRSSSSGVSDE